MEHGHALLPHGLGRLLEIQFLRHRDDKHIVTALGPMGHQRLEYAGRILSQRLRHGHAVHRLISMGIVPGLIGDLLLIQNAHHIGLLFFHSYHTFLTAGYFSTFSQR